MRVCSRGLEIVHLKNRTPKKVIRTVPNIGISQYWDNGGEIGIIKKEVVALTCGAKWEPDLQNNLIDDFANECFLTNRGV